MEDGYGCESSRTLRGAEFRAISHSATSNPPSALALALETIKEELRDVL